MWRQEYNRYLRELTQPDFDAHPLQELSLWVFPNSSAEMSVALANAVVRVLPSPGPGKFFVAAERLASRWAYATARIGFPYFAEEYDNEPGLRNMARLARRVSTEFGLQGLIPYQHVTTVYADRLCAYAMGTFVMRSLAMPRKLNPSFVGVLAERAVVAGADNQGLLERIAHFICRSLGSEMIDRMFGRFATGIGDGLRHPWEPDSADFAARRLETCAPYEMATLLGQRHIRKPVEEDTGPARFFGPLTRNKHFAKKAATLPDELYAWSTAK